jgi:hypothetical protein
MMAWSAACGFPSPAEDYVDRPLDELADIPPQPPRPPIPIGMLSRDLANALDELPLMVGQALWECAVADGHGPA